VPAEFSTFAIDLDQVRNTVGSKNRSLLPALKNRFSAWFENVNEQLADSDRGPPLEEVLELLIAGKPIDPRWSFQFAVAVEVLYRHFGMELPAPQFESMRIGWASQVDAAIQQAGVPQERFGLIAHLFERGPVIPFEVEFCMGYLSLSEVRAALDTFARADYTSMEPDVREAVTEVRSWLETCNSLNRDLASFYSDAV
jgi:hypothetical protein